MVGGFARSRHYDEANRASEQIENPLKFAEGLIEQAIEQHADGNDTQALQMLSEARELIRSEPCREAGSIIVRDYSRSQLAFGYATLRDFKTGLSEAMLIADPETQFTTLIELGWEAAQAGFTDSIFEIHDAISGEYGRIKYLVSISDALLQKGNKELAIKLSLRALEAADKVQRTDQRCRMSIKIASQLIAGELEAKANEILAAVLNITAEIQDAHQRAQILLAMAGEYQQHARPLSENEKGLIEKIPV